jgi:hypothetical protein
MAQSELQTAVASKATSSPRDASISLSILSEFLTAFDTGDHVDLFILWQNHVPRSLLRLRDLNSPNSTTPEHQEALQVGEQIKDKTKEP